ncbi:MAG: thioredoxin-dependent thiol peroxidase [Chloroflexi bacterium]|nr:thioredoxin-dependent thiol peroxidase [Chloroflexota bacterium]
MTTLKPGDMAPDFELVSDEGTKVRLSSLRGRKVVLYFYPKDDTPGCTKQACGFRDAYADLESVEAVVVGVSPDSPESHTRFKRKFRLPFTLLSDPDHTVASHYGAWGEKTLYGKKFEGILRSHFVLDEGGVILDARIKVLPEDSVRFARETVGGASH